MNKFLKIQLKIKIFPKNNKKLNQKENQIFKH